MLTSGWLNRMDLNMCLSLSDDHKTIIAHENPERTYVA